MATYVERTETRAVRVKRIIVEIGELLSDSVDVCHGFSVGLVGSERGVTGVAPLAAAHLVIFIDAQYSLSCHVFFAPSISPLHPTEGIGQGVISHISQRQRCSFFSYVHQLVSKYDTRATVHVLHRSTFSTMIRYLTHFISIGWLLP
jgi:hypothetical protein